MAPTELGSIVKFQMLQASCFCMPFMLVDVGATPFSCGLLAVASTAILTPLLLMVLKRPWLETIMLTITSIVFSMVLSALVGVLLRPNQLIYGYMRANHIPVTLVFVILLTFTLIIPMLVYVLWNSNKRGPSLFEATTSSLDSMPAQLDTSLQTDSQPDSSSLSIDLRTAQSNSAEFNNDTER